MKSYYEPFTVNIVNFRFLYDGEHGSAKIPFIKALRGMFRGMSLKTAKDISDYVTDWDFPSSIKLEFFRENFVDYVRTPDGRIYPASICYIDSSSVHNFSIDESDIEKMKRIFNLENENHLSSGMINDYRRKIREFHDKIGGMDFKGKNLVRSKLLKIASMADEIEQIHTDIDFFFEKIHGEEYE